MEGTVFTVPPKQIYVFAKGDDGVMYFCSSREMPTDSVGRQYLLLGERISFTPFKEQRGWDAKNIALLSERAPLSPLFRETGVVDFVSPKGDFCFLTRHRSSKSIFLHVASTRTRCSLFIGQQWNYAVAAPTTKDRWQAIDAYVVIPENEKHETAIKEEVAA